MLLIALLLMVAAPVKVSAQSSLFGKEGSAANREYSTRGAMMGNRSGVDDGFTLGGAENENPTTNAPLGSGVMMLIAAGAGYALLKRKEDQQ